MSRFTMNDLAEMVCAPEATPETKRMALSVAYQLGRTDAQKEFLLCHVREQGAGPGEVTFLPDRWFR